MSFEPRNPNDTPLCTVQVYEDSTDPTRSYAVFEGSDACFSDAPPESQDDRVQFKHRILSIIGVLDTLTGDLKKRVVLAQMASMLGIDPKLLAQATGLAGHDSGPSKAEIDRALDAMKKEMEK